MSDLVIETPRVFMPLLANHMPDGTPVRYKGAHGGRGSGKSHNFGDLWLEENVSDKFDVVCVRETLKSLEFSVKKLLESKIEAFNAGDYFDVQDRRILSRNGGTTIFEGMQNHTAESIKSLEGFDRAWFTEAQNATEKSLTILRPTIRKPGSQIWADWNPSKATDPIDALLRGAEPPPARSWSKRTSWTTRGCRTCCGPKWSTTSAATRTSTRTCGSASTSSAPKRASLRTG